VENESARGPLPPLVFPAPPAPPKRRHTFLIGFIALFPLMLSFFVLNILWQIIDKMIGPTLGTGINWVVSKTGLFAEPPSE